MNATDNRSGFWTQDVWNSIDNGVSAAAGAMAESTPATAKFRWNHLAGLIGPQEKKHE